MSRQLDVERVLYCKPACKGMTYPIQYKHILVCDGTPMESAATDLVNALLKEKAKKYTSLTLAGLKRIASSLVGYTGHIIIDDLGVEKSQWSRTATITVLSHLVYSHYVHKISRDQEILIENFYGSAAINIQPVLMDSIVADMDWIALTRDKALRYYHLIRPLNPKMHLPQVELDWGQPLKSVATPRKRGKLWYQLIAIGLTQWSHARCKEHLTKLLQACAALDNRIKVTTSDYRLLIKILRPMQLERYVLETYGFETGRKFNNNLYCLLVELATYGEPTVEVISEDYKVSPSTVTRICETEAQWVWIKHGSKPQICPREPAMKILDLAGVNQKW